MSVIVKSTPSGEAIRLKDIAKVELAAEDYSFNGRLNMKPMAVIQVLPLSDANAINLAEQSNKKMEELSRNFPKGMTYQVIRNEAEFIEAPLDEDGVIPAELDRILATEKVKLIYLIPTFHQHR